MNMIHKNYNLLDRGDFIERDMQIAQLWKKLSYEEKLKWNEVAQDYESKNNHKGISKSDIKLYNVYCKNYLMNNLPKLIGDIEEGEYDEFHINENQVALLKLIEQAHKGGKNLYDKIRFVIKCLDEADTFSDFKGKDLFISNILSERHYDSKADLKQDWDLVLQKLDLILQTKFKDLSKFEKFSVSFASRQILNLLPLIPNAPKFINDYIDVEQYSRVGLSLFEIFYFENLKPISNPLEFFQNMMKYSVSVIEKWDSVSSSELLLYKEKFRNQRFGTLVSTSLLKVLKTSAYVLNLRNNFYYLLLKEKTSNVSKLEKPTNSGLDEEVFANNSTEEGEIELNKIDSPTLFQDINSQWEIMMKDNSLKSASDLLNKKINDYNMNKETKTFSETVLLMHKYDRIAKLENLSAFQYFIEINYSHFKDILYLLYKSRKDELKKQKLPCSAGGGDFSYKDMAHANDTKESFSSSFYDFYDFQLVNLRKLITLRKLINEWKGLPEKEKRKYVLLKDIMKSQDSFHKTTSFESKEKRIFFDTLIAQKIIDKPNVIHPIDFKDMKRVPLDLNIINLYDDRREKLLKIFNKIDDVVIFKEKVFNKYNEGSWKKFSVKPYNPLEYIARMLSLQPDPENLKAFPKFKDYFHSRFPDIYQKTFESSELRDIKEFDNLFQSIKTGIPLLTKMVNQIFDEHVNIYEKTLTHNFMNEKMYNSWEATLDFSQNSAQISLPISYRSAYNYYRHVIKGLENSIFKYENYSQNTLPPEFEKNMKEKARKANKIDVNLSDKSYKLFRELVHWSNVYKLKNKNSKIQYVSAPTPKLFYLMLNHPNHQILKVLKKFPNENPNKIINRVLHNAYMYYYRHGQSDSWERYREEAAKCKTDRHELDFSCYLELQQKIQIKKYEKLNELSKTLPNVSILDCELTKSENSDIVNEIKAKYDDLATGFGNEP